MENYLEHKEIGNQLDYFHFQDISSGNVFWHEKGLKLYQNIENYMRSLYKKNGYMEVKSPIMLDKSLWEKSGHWDKFKDNMFVLNMDDENEKRVLAVKPMSCPAHIEIFKKMSASYKQLPIKIGEFGLCHRNEQSGSLNGLLRMRSFVQDDGHVFCEIDQVKQECLKFSQVLLEVYGKFGFEEVKIKFSSRPEKRVGSDELWDKSEKVLLECLESLGVEYEVNEGEGAFYGPKLEFVLKDRMGRDWQCGTLQLDFFLGEKLDAKYVKSDGSKDYPIILHRAILGSMERFIAILLEHYQGKLPYWLSPVKAVVVNINEKQEQYCSDVYKQLMIEGLDVELDISNERVSKKSLLHRENKIPYMIVIGDKEIANNSVSIKDVRSGKSEIVKVKDLVKWFKEKE